MIESLFDLPESKSPRLKWQDKHDITVIDTGIDHEHGDECDITGNQLYRFWAVMGEGAEECGGHTELDALTDLAIKCNLKLWNQP